MKLKWFFILILINLFVACNGDKKNQAQNVSTPDSEAASTAYQNSSWSTTTMGVLDANNALEMTKKFFEDENSFVFGKKLELLVKEKSLKTTHPVSYESKGLLLGSATISGISYYNDALITVEPNFPNVSARAGTVNFINYSDTDGLKIHGTVSLSSNLIAITTNIGAYDEVIKGGVSFLYKNLAYNLTIEFVVTGKEVSSDDLLTITKTYHVIYSCTDANAKKFSGSFDVVKTKTISENARLQAEAFAAHQSSSWSTATVGVIDKLNASELTTAFLKGGRTDGFVFSKKLKGVIHNKYQKSTKIINSIDSGILSGSATITGDSFSNDEIAITPTYPRVAQKIETILCHNYADDTNLKVNGKIIFNSSSIDIDADNRASNKVFTGAASFLYKDIAYNIVFKWVLTINDVNTNPSSTTYNVEYIYIDENGKSITGTEVVAF